MTGPAHSVTVASANYSYSYPQVIGVPGGGLAGAGKTWAKNDAVAAAGAAGESRTADVLNRLAAPGGPTVLHDLMVPSDRYKANIDHVVVSATKVLLVDSKMWRPGRYWTLFGRTRCGWTPVGHADKKTMPLAAKLLESYLRSRGLAVEVLRPAVAVWPSGAGRCSVRWYRPNGARPVEGAAVGKVAAQVGSAPADPALIAALVPLVVSVAERSERPAPTRPPSAPAGRSTPTPAPTGFRPNISASDVYRSDDF